MRRTPSPSMSTEITLRVVNAINDVTPTAWDACANPASDTGAAPDYNPFISHDFLASLELSGSVRNRAGWQPMHLVAEAGGELLGAVPCYLKSHSQGEYVFDHGWADAFQRAGGSYYPKIQVSVPFTPVTGPRFLIAPGEAPGEATAALVAGLRALRRETRASSVHVTFLPEAEADRAEELGFLRRVDQQFHWDNPGYGSFEDFLAALASRKRKAIRRERRDALAA